MMMTLSSTWKMFHLHETHLSGFLMKCVVDTSRTQYTFRVGWLTTEQTWRRYGIRFQNLDSIKNSFAKCGLAWLTKHFSFGPSLLCYSSPSIMQVSSVHKKGSICRDAEHICPSNCALSWTVRILLETSRVTWHGRSWDDDLWCRNPRNLF